MTKQINSEFQTQLLQAEPHPGISRRRFLGLCAAGLGLMVMPGFQANAATSTGAKVGLQLYTLRDLMAKSVPETLKLVASVGYKELEFAGYFDQSPKQIRSLLDGLGLSSPSGHVPLEMLDKEINAVIDTALEVGQRYIVLPYLSAEQRGTGIDTYQRLAEKMNKFGAACTKAGLQFAYHNHDFEFIKTDGQIPYDVLLTQTDPKHVKMELDLYWTVKAGLDPVSLFRQHPGRFPLWHVKDMDKAGNFADVGKGIIDFKSIFAQAKLAGVEHKFVERDQTDDTMRTIVQGYSAVKALS